MLIHGWFQTTGSIPGKWSQLTHLLSICSGWNQPILLMFFKTWENPLMFHSNCSGNVYRFWFSRQTHKNCGHFLPGWCRVWNLSFCGFRPSFNSCWETSSLLWPCWLPLFICRWECTLAIASPPPRVVLWQRNPPCCKMFKGPSTKMTCIL